MKRVLLIEDDPDIREGLKLLLTERGMDVDEAAVGSDALRLLQERPPYDLIVSDILVPEADGFEIMMAARRAHPSTRILAISGGGILRTPVYLQDAGHFGADATLAKPFASSELDRELEQLGF